MKTSFQLKLAPRRDVVCIREVECMLFPRIYLCQGIPNVGFTIDPAIERWNFARQNAYSYFKATPKTTVVGLIMGIGLPACLVFAIVKSKTKENERIDKGLQKKPRNYLAF
ncbi:hypothetical protein BSL78_15142 [Apostichopus japonicus]|uniref:NADH dehydrogenase [ubiquinone] 1 beta subcomplex subunit 4 n=1 Tax=Stichopus japonicus TaxID=307972 RepID=A0A2G8KJ23_STIJA|nr:hypothetical protein BSL78_15142 [Apostichopus japonicus]